MLAVIALGSIAACGGGGGGGYGTTSPPPPPPPPPAVPGAPANAGRDIVDTKLSFDIGAQTGSAAITFAASSSAGATLEVGDLEIDSVKLAGANLAYARDAALNTISLDLAIADRELTVDVAFRYKHHAGLNGANANGYTFLWPYLCRNLFPCHSLPADGSTFSLNLTGVPAGKTALYSPTLGIAPSYQVAWAIDNYVELPLGRTTAGTQVSAWHRPAELAAIQAGTRNLVGVFDWYERTLGPYRFGDKVGAISVGWDGAAQGAVETHPRWHVSANSLGNEETNAHEPAHGWFGNGVRLACWEDFVLSEGTVSYLTARSLSAVAPAVGAQVWNRYAGLLAQIPGSNPVWPQTCNAVDILRDNLFTNAPYMRGAFFYKAVADKVGADKLDQALAAFYREYAGKPAHMADMLVTIRNTTGYDPATCAQAWLRSTTVPPIGPCP